jgi:hypothetical protein
MWFDVATHRATCVARRTGKIGIVSRRNSTEHPTIRHKEPRIRDLFVAESTLDDAKLMIVNPPAELSEGSVGLDRWAEVA